MQVDWAEMPTRPKLYGRERRVYALICSLPFSGASTAHFSFDMTAESFLEGHVRAFAWLGGVPREYEQFLEALLEAEVFARDASGARQRVRHAGFPAHKTLDDFDFTAQPGAEKPLILHLAQLAWITERSNVCFFGPPGTGKTHLAIALAIKACQAGHRVAFATAQQWVDRLDAAQHHNALDDELRRPRALRAAGRRRDRLPALERQAANLLFALVARRYERGSIIVTSNRGFEAWGEILGDAMVAAALIDRLVHHAHMVTLKGKSYRLRERGSGPTPAQPTPDSKQPL